MMMLRLLLLTSALNVLTALPASAHTEIAETIPEADSTMTDPPIEVVIEFAADLLVGSTVDIRVIDPGGDDLVAAPAELEGRVATVPLNQAVHEGEHTVDVAFTADDGDDQIESFSFIYAPPAGIATPTEILTGPPVEPAPTETATPAPTATPTPEPIPPATPTPTATPIPTDEVTENDTEPLSAEGGGISGGLAVLLAIVVAAAAAGVILLRMRRPAAEDFGVSDPDQHG